MLKKKPLWKDGYFLKKSSLKREIALCYGFDGNKNKARNLDFSVILQCNLSHTKNQWALLTSTWNVLILN